MSLANVLVVEDNPADQMLLQEVMTEAGWVDRCYVAPDAEKAWAVLNDASCKIDLVILDLNLPNKCGRDLLSEIRQVQQYKSVPIVVLTASDLSSDFHGSYQSGANCYLNKSSDLDDYINTISRIRDIWRFLKESN